MRTEEETMEGGIFWGGSVVAAAIAGVIALFAPCCISVMLPAYFAGAFRNRGVMAAMTFLFAAGVATIVLPIAMGAAFVRRLITTQHTPIYVTGGVVMVGMAAYLLAGGKLHLPTPGRRAGGRGGPLSVYSLGVFSGVATACCAPVLAGVIALSGVASSFGLALGLGLAYVFGMVAPLFAISLAWEWRDWRSSRLFRPRSFTYRVGQFQRRITIGDLASAVLLAVMGVAMIGVGVARDGMEPTSGWQLRLSSRLQHYGHVLTDALTWLPGWLAAGIIGALAVALASRALHQIGWIGRSEQADAGDTVRR
jgi:cytochrome c-type biogenesis protein